MSRLFHHEKELAVARAANKLGTFYAVSTMATSSLEEIATVSAGPKIFQLYILKDRALTRELIARCKAAKYDALCLTVDTPMAGNRERDLMTGMTVPPSFGLNSLMSFAMRPHWVFNYLRDSNFNYENISHRVDGLKDGVVGLANYVNSQFDRSVTWDDAAWLVKQWDGPLIIKGLQSDADARKALAIGASAVMISNHGGRQLDGAPAPIDCVKSIRDAVGDSLELIIDGGIRRGSHVVKALAAGANACSIGRPYLYGLAAGGQPGVEHALNILKTEIERTMTLLGCNNIADLSGQHLNIRRL
jgi:L-lactate dehydrogenase (cytochrome)